MCSKCIASSCDGAIYRTTEAVYQFATLREKRFVSGCKNSINVVFLANEPHLYALDWDMQPIYYKLEREDA